jgi:uncharacterized membrane protein
MTEAELWHMQLLAVDNSIGGVSVLLTLISGYLAVAYLVGRRLGRFQVGLISIFFALGAGLGAFLTLVQFRRAAYFIEQLETQFGVHSYMPNAAMNYLGGIVMFLLIPAALFFMYQIRRNPALGADQGQAGSSQGRRYFD